MCVLMCVRHVGVLQELAVSQSICVYCGDIELQQRQADAPGGPENMRTSSLAP